MWHGSLILSFLLLNPHTRWLYTPVIKCRAVWVGGWRGSSESDRLPFLSLLWKSFTTSTVTRAVLRSLRAHRALYCAALSPSVMSGSSATPWTVACSSIHGISQARLLEWVVISFSRRSSQPRNQMWISCVSCIAGRFFTLGATGEALDGFRQFLSEASFPQLCTEYLKISAL